MQHNSSGKCYIDVHVQPTLAFFITHSFNPKSFTSNLLHGGLGDAVASAWLNTADSVLNQAFAALLSEDEHVLTAMVAVTSSDLLPAGSATMCSDPTQILANGVSPATSLLVKLVISLHVMMECFTRELPRMQKVSASDSPETSTILTMLLEGQQATNKESAQPQAQTQSHAKSDSQLSSSQLAMSDAQSILQLDTEIDSVPSCEPTAAATDRSPGQLVRKLRSLLLVLKLACLTYAGQGTSEPPMLQITLWRTINLQRFVLLDILSEDAWQASSDIEQQEIHSLYMLVAQLAMSVVRRSVLLASRSQAAASEASEAAAETLGIGQNAVAGAMCLAVLAMLMSFGPHTSRLAISQELYRLGKLMMLTEFVHQTNSQDHSSIVHIVCESKPSSSLLQL